MAYTGEKKRAYQRTWLAARRASYVAGQRCVHCGSLEKLELDHIDSTAKAASWSHAIWSWTKARLEAELAKCQWLCHVCHLKKSIADWRRNPNSAPPLSDDAIREIRASHETSKVVGRRFGVDGSTIRRIRRRERYQHVL
jgi:5-methylcytosine-specific restriction endonuclease McrA